jgi:hypothetical protein
MAPPPGQSGLLSLLELWTPSMRSSSRPPVTRVASSLKIDLLQKPCGRWDRRPKQNSALLWSRRRFGHRKSALVIANPVTVAPSRKLGVDHSRKYGRDAGESRDQLAAQSRQLAFMQSEGRKRGKRQTDFQWNGKSSPISTTASLMSGARR